MTGVAADGEPQEAAQEGNFKRAGRGKWLLVAIQMSLVSRTTNLPYFSTWPEPFELHTTDDWMNDSAALILIGY